jgi:RNA recognition motif-containing protein
MVDVKRVFVGGLTPEITVDELKERFQRFCEVLDVQIKKKRNCESMLIGKWKVIKL